MSDQLNYDYIPTNYKHSNAKVCGVNVGIVASVLLIYVGTMVYIFSSVYLRLYGSYA